MRSSSAWFAKGTRFGDVMADDPFRDFLRVCPELSFDRGAFLFRQGTPATHLHVVAVGQVKLSVPTAAGHERVIAV